MGVQHHTWLRKETSWGTKAGLQGFVEKEDRQNREDKRQVVCAYGVLALSCYCPWYHHGCFSGEGTGPGLWSVWLLHFTGEETEAWSLPITAYSRAGWEASGLGRVPRGEAFRFPCLADSCRHHQPCQGSARGCCCGGNSSSVAWNSVPSWPGLRSVSNLRWPALGQLWST